MVALPFRIVCYQGDLQACVGRDTDILLSRDKQVSDYCSRRHAQSSNIGAHMVSPIGHWLHVVPDRFSRTQPNRRKYAPVNFSTWHFTRRTTSLNNTTIDRRRASSRQIECIINAILNVHDSTILKHGTVPRAGIRGGNPNIAGLLHIGEQQNTHISVNVAEEAPSEAIHCTVNTGCCSQYSASVSVHSALLAT